MKFSLVIPCYNEGANLPLLLDRCKELTCQPDIEIILVDNGSTDDSSLIMKKLLSQYPRCRSMLVEKNLGYGFGLLAGLKVAKGDLLGWTHADMQTDPLDILNGLTLFERHGVNTFIKGRRYGRPFTDLVFTLGMSIFETILLGRVMWDINAQPTMFSKTFFETWEDPPSDFSLDLYAYYQAHCQDLKIHRFPVKVDERAHGVSRWNSGWAARQKLIRRTINFSLQLKKSLNA